MDGVAGIITKVLANLACGEFLFDIESFFLGGGELGGRKLTLLLLFFRSVY